MKKMLLLGTAAAMFLFSACQNNVDDDANHDGVDPVNKTENTDVDVNVEGTTPAETPEATPEGETK